MISAGNDPAALQQVRHAAATLLADGHVEEAVEVVIAALAAVLEQTRDLELLVTKLRRAQGSPRSERVDSAQLALLFEQLCGQHPRPALPDPEAEARADTELDQLIEAAEQAQEAQTPRRPRRRRDRRRTVERQVHQIDVPPQERTCGQCGDETARIGVDITRSLEYVPGHFIEHEHHRAKYACPRCKEGVITAPRPAPVIERSAADASLLAHVVVSKYGDHCPLHRLHRIYARSGVEIAVSTLADWVAGVADLVTPVVDRLAQRVLEATVVRTDATGLKVLDPSSAHNIERGTIWCYVGDDRDVVFRYTPTGEGETGPWTFLAGRMGYVQADAASVFDRVFNGHVAAAVEVGCWAHGRRRLVAQQDVDCRVAYPLKLIARLYRIEHLADAQQLNVSERTTLRQERARPVLDTLQRWLVITHRDEPPSSELAKASGYLLNHWAALTRFVDDGRLSLDNNLCEQQLRDLALGRKNYLFAGSHAAACRAAALYSLLRTCAQHGVPPLPYLTDVLRKLAADWPQSRLDELLPDRWQALHGQPLEP